MGASRGEELNSGLLFEESGLALGIEAWRQILQERIAVRPHREHDLGPTLRGLLQGMCEEEVPVAGQAGALSSDADELREDFIEHVLLAPARESQDGDRPEVMLLCSSPRSVRRPRRRHLREQRRLSKVLRGELDDHIKTAPAARCVASDSPGSVRIGAPRDESRMGPGAPGPLPPQLCKRADTPRR